MRPTQHVEPVAPVERRGRGRTAIAAAIPLVILLGVVGLGVLDTVGSPTATRPPVGTAAPTPAPATAVPIASGEAPQAAETTPFYPSRIVGISTVDPATVNRMARAGLDSDRLVAVAGWLTLGPASADCAKAWELCRRFGLLSEVPTVDGGSSLFLETRPDVTVAGTTRAGSRGDGWTVASTAVVVGRFVPRVDRECGLRRPVCERVFAAELIAWVGDDVSVDVRPRGASIRGASLTPDEATTIARRSIRGAGEVIGATLVDRSRLATLEQDAASVATGGDGPVWLVRTVSFRARLDVWYEPLAGWAVVDDATGEVLAAEPSRRLGSGVRPWIQGLAD